MKTEVIKKRKTFYAEEDIVKKIEELSDKDINFTDVVEYAIINLPDNFDIKKEDRLMKTYYLSPEVIKKLESLSKKNKVKYYDIFKAGINNLYNSMKNTKERK